MTTGVSGLPSEASRAIPCSLSGGTHEDAQPSSYSRYHFQHIHILTSNKGLAFAT